MNYIIKVGTSPAGVEWNVYVNKGDDLQKAMQKADAQKKRLAEIWAKHDAKEANR